MDDRALSLYTGLIAIDSWSYPNIEGRWMDDDGAPFVR